MLVSFFSCILALALFTGFCILVLDTTSQVERLDAMLKEDEKKTDERKEKNFYKTML